MTNIMTFAVSASTFALSVSAIWVAVWAWRTFRVSVLMWLVAGRVIGAASLLLMIVPDRAKLDSAIRTLQTQSDLNPADLFVSIASLNTFFPTLSTLGFLLIALGEISHFGRRIATSYEPHWVLVLVYRLRNLFGVIAVTSALVPTTVLYIWLRSIP